MMSIENQHGQDTNEKERDNTFQPEAIEGVEEYQQETGKEDKEVTIEDGNKEEYNDEDDDRDTEALIAQAAAAAVEAATNDVDVTAVAYAAALAVEEAANKAEEDADHDEGNKMDNPGENASNKVEQHQGMLAVRRLKDRDRYAHMTTEQRNAYNKKRRDQYHKQSETTRTKKRERERYRYNSASPDAANKRNSRRAKLERERYAKLTSKDLATKNLKRRERAAESRQDEKGNKVRHVLLYIMVTFMI
jgi:hypothetical protein